MSHSTGRSSGFPPVARVDARVLILGSLPGQMSLARRQYYARPQNAFWRIMGELAGASPDLPYPKRQERLMESGIALWDVCAAGLRTGSLDSNIREPQPNNFNIFFNAHQHIELVCFNGAKAAELYRRSVHPTLFPVAREMRTQTLPSTSSAYAQLRFAQKLERWREVLG